MRTEAERRAGAEHEAAHCVASLALGIELAEVVLDGDSVFAPFTRLRPDPRVLPVNGKRKYASWARSCDEITMLLVPLVHGCPVMPLALLTALDDIPAADDVSRARATARALCRSERAADALITALAYRAIDVAEAPGFAEALASFRDELMREGRLAGRDLDLALERAKVASWAAQPPTKGDGYVQAA